MSNFTKSVLKTHFLTILSLPWSLLIFSVTLLLMKAVFIFLAKSLSMLFVIPLIILSYLILRKIITNYFSDIYNKPIFTWGLFFAYVLSLLLASFAVSNVIYSITCMIPSIWSEFIKMNTIYCDPIDDESTNRMRNRALSIGSNRSVDDEPTNRMRNRALSIDSNRSVDEATNRAADEDADAIRWRAAYSETVYAQVNRGINVFHPDEPMDDISISDLPVEHIPSMVNIPPVPEVAFERRDWSNYDVINAAMRERIDNSIIMVNGVNPVTIGDPNPQGTSIVVYAKSIYVNNERVDLTELRSNPNEGVRINVNTDTIYINDKVFSLQANRSCGFYQEHARGVTGGGRILERFARIWPSPGENNLLKRFGMVLLVE